MVRAGELVRSLTLSLFLGFRPALENRRALADMARTVGAGFGTAVWVVICETVFVFVRVLVYVLVFCIYHCVQARPDRRALCTQKARTEGLQSPP